MDGIKWSFSRLTLVTVAWVSLGCLGGAAAENDPTRWEKDIRAFEKQDEQNPPPKGAVLFTGSSSIRMWHTLNNDFQGVKIISRGFGGSQMEDLLHYADRIVLPYQPSKIFVYEGDNDISAGKKPERVAREFDAFVKKVHRKLPETEIYFISIKPSPSRWHLAQPMRAANAFIESYADRMDRVGYVDIWNPMLGADGKPRKELFTGDDLHMNAEGYAVWIKALKPQVEGND